MATKYRLGENLLKVLGQSLKDSKITIQESMLYVSQATNLYIRNLIWSNKSLGERTIPYGVFRNYDLKTEKDTSKNMLYVSLPIRSLESLHNNMGIFQVVPCGSFESLIPVNKGFLGLYAGRASYTLEGQLAYLPERDRLYIIGADPNEQLEFTVTIIPDSTGLQPDDELPLPPDAENEVINIAIQQMQITMELPQDIQNNNKYP